MSAAGQFLECFRRHVDGVGRLGKWCHFYNCCDVIGHYSWCNAERRCRAVRIDQADLIADTDGKRIGNPSTNDGIAARCKVGCLDISPKVKDVDLRF